MTIVRFFVPGRPQTAGSKTAIPTARGARVIEAGTRESRARKRWWRGDLMDAALTAMGGADPLDGPVSLTVVIVRRRPAAHLRANGLVKPGPHGFLPVQRPDTVKVVRALEDALTGVCWRDDSQVVRHALYKAFADQVWLDPRREGVYVEVSGAPVYVGPRFGDCLPTSEREAVA